MAGFEKLKCLQRPAGNTNEYTEASVRKATAPMLVMNGFWP